MKAELLKPLRRSPPSQFHERSIEIIFIMSFDWKITNTFDAYSSIMENGAPNAEQFCAFEWKIYFAFIFLTLNVIAIAVVDL